VAKKKAASIVLSVLAACAITYTLVIYFSPLPVKVIDRDSSGLVSVREVVDSLDIGKQEVQGMPGCVTYFWLKDGSTAYMSCSTTK